MHPVLFSLGEIDFYTYGLMVGLGFIAGVLVASKRAEKRGIDPDSLFWFFIALLIGGVMGGRVFHLALSGWQYGDWLSLIDTRDGGLSIHGVLVGGMVSIAVYSKVKKVSFLDLGDIVVPGVALGQSIGRIGCFFSGCCYGIETGGTWGVCTRFAPGLRHPYQLYESAADLLLFFLLLKISERICVRGGLFLRYVLGYSIIRFFLEFVRDNDSYVLGLSYGQWASAAAALAALGLIYLLEKGYRSKKTTTSN